MITAEFKDYVLVTVYVPNSGVKDLARINYRVNQWDVDFHKYV